MQQGTTAEQMKINSGKSNKIPMKEPMASGRRQETCCNLPVWKNSGKVCGSQLFKPFILKMLNKENNSFRKHVMQCMCCNCKICKCRAMLDRSAGNTFPFMPVGSTQLCQSALKIDSLLTSSGKSNTEEQRQQKPSHPQKSNLKVKFWQQKFTTAKSDSISWQFVAQDVASLVQCCHDGAYSRGRNIY